MNLVPYVPPSQGEPPLPALTPDQMAEAKAAASAGLAIVAEPGHCGGRAMDMENHPKGRAILDKFRQGPSLPTPSGDRPRTAVASSGGMDVDLHLGHAASFLIYGKDAKDGLVSLLDKRDAPEPGTGDGRWHKLAETLGDCSVVLAAGAGQRPRDVLGSHGIRVLVTEGSVEGAVDALYGGGKGRGKRP
jgi:nitrogen fixation protein NifB